MCGIFGYIGKRSPIAECLNGLKRLEYRGYDSSGIASITQNGLQFFKAEGKLHRLREKLSTSLPDAFVAIGHTRWATHGSPTEINAHPHLDTKQSLAVVHNGIIENYHEIKKTLESEGVVFTSKTDTEIIAHLIGKYYRNSFIEAFRQALSELRGSFSLAVIHEKHPEEIFLAAHQCPLAIACNSATSESYIASDPNAFLGEDLRVTFLENNEIATLSKGSVIFYDTMGQSLIKEVTSMSFDPQQLSKGSYEHYMLKEIHEQPTTIRRTLQGRLNEDYGTVQFPELAFSAVEMHDISRVLILGCGTSYHAGCIGVSFLENIARIPGECAISSEYRYTNPIIAPGTLVIALSQSGETADTIAAVREVKAKGAKTLALCNVRHSTLTREADGFLDLRAGPEISVASTKAFTSQLSLLLLLSIYLARQRHMSKEEGIDYITELKHLPMLLEKLLLQSTAIDLCAQQHCAFSQFFFLGRQYMFPTGLEAALKLKEISYIAATGYPAGELKHGPLALIDEEVVVVGLCGNHKTFDKLISNLEEAKARGCTILAFAPENDHERLHCADTIITLPNTSDYIAPIPYAVATQLFAYYTAKALDRDIDRPKNLAKSVTVE